MVQGGEVASWAVNRGQGWREGSQVTVGARCTEGRRS